MSAETVERQLTEARMKDREGAGLAGKVAIVSGGGAAGDGIGNGRAAAILLALAARHNGTLATFDTGIPVSAVRTAKAGNLCVI